MPEPPSEPLIPSLSRLLLLSLLGDILQIRDEGEQLGHGLRSALDQRSVPEQHRIRSFAHNLCRQCDSLYGASLTPVIQETGIENRQNHEQLNNSDDVKQTTFQRTDDRNSRLIHVEGADEGGELASDAFCTAFFTPIMETTASSGVVGATIIASSPNVMPSIAPTTPDRTTSSISLTSSPGNLRAACKPLFDRQMTPGKRSGRLGVARTRKRKARPGEQDSPGEKDKRQKKANGTGQEVAWGINSTEEDW
ncbi:hypothetical protein NW759_015962 [Fusarium solani]|nr:hypothetical protein NW759_015962 [Fusarium solani]